MVETLQLFPLCLWTMLQRVKVGHIALSQMVISIFGPKRGHLIYLPPNLQHSQLFGNSIQDEQGSSFTHHIIKFTAITVQHTTGAATSSSARAFLR
jgi:hypothetical protein